MARIAGVDIPNNKRLVTSLTYIFGIGSSSAGMICEKTSIDPEIKTSELTEDQARLIRNIIEKYFQVEGALVLISGSIDVFSQIMPAHEDPQVPNYECFTMPNPKLEVGMVLALEPMFNLGTKQVRTLADEWTVVTTDGSVSAHYEHTIAITDDGPRVLTER